jgi:hypothetical protein
VVESYQLWDKLNEGILDGEDLGDLCEEGLEVNKGRKMVRYQELLDLLAGTEMKKKHTLNTVRKCWTICNNIRENSK